MSKQFLRRDPFACVLCGGDMVYRRAVAGLNVQGLKIHARDISLMRYIPVGLTLAINWRIFIFNDSGHLLLFLPRKSHGKQFRIR